MDVVSVDKAKRIDKETMDDVGIPGIILMENAAENIFKSIVHKGNSFLFFCGVGNNGGDGLAIARKLFLDKKDVIIYITGELKKATSEFLVNYNILKKLDIPMNNVSVIDEKLINDIKNVDIVVDSIMGIGLNRDIDGNLYDLIDTINENSNYTISIDNPTGLDADTGKERGIAIIAAETFAVEVLKKGYFNVGSKEYLGNISLVKIGVPENIIRRNTEDIKLIDRECYKMIIPKRGIYDHKGSYGKTVILAGSMGMTGAAYITTQAAVKTGAGLVSLVIEKDIQPILSSKLIEAMTISYDEEEKIDKLISEASVIICGPGLSKKEINKEMLYKFINSSTCPIVLDADALNIISEDVKILDKLRYRSIFTPHSGEMARMTKKTIKEINSNRIDVCREYAQNNIITLLKGYNTVISNGKEVVINSSGNSKMASGGMGDCLTGIIGSLVSQGVNIYESAVLGAYLHGAIGDRISKEKYVVTAEDMLGEISKFMEDMLR